MNKVTVIDKMQSNYTYELIEPAGQNFDALFSSEVTPKKLLELGIFGGKYMNEAKKEFPDDCFINAKLSKVKNIELNYVSIDASQALIE